jgi:uncharacterized protein (TIGR03067 family)
MPGVVVSALLLLAAGTAALAAPAPFDRPERPGHNHDFARLQGTWTRDDVYLWRDGLWVKAGAFGVTTLTVRGNHFAWVGNFAPPALVERFTLHKGPYPRGIDFTPPNASVLERAVYTIEGGTLTIVLPTVREERPSLERGRVKLVYRRQR